MDENSETFKKAEARRRKLLEQREARMKKILGQHASLPESDQLVDGPDDDGVNLSGPPAELDSCEKSNLELRERLICKESASSESSEFPRKVSLISTPVDFKTVKQNQDQKSSWNLVVISLLWYLQSNISSLTSISLVVLIALISSFSKLNFCLPFLLSLLLLTIFRVATRTSIQNVNYVKVLLSVVDYFVIFLTFYILGLILL